MENDFLGMEIELIGHRIILDNSQKGINDEQQIKNRAFYLCDFNHEFLVHYTLDTRVNFNPTDTYISTVPELIFYHPEFPVSKIFNKENFDKFINQLIEAISTFSFLAFITNYIGYPAIRLHKIGANGKLGTEETFLKIHSVDNKYSDTVMIHITFACPLSQIYATPIELDAVSNNCKNFINLIQTLNNGCTSAMGDNDPKQQMPVVNRTSFGAIFSTLNNEEKEFILGYLKEEYKDSPNQIGLNGGTIWNLVKYLEDLKDGKKGIDDDPTYKANEKECLGISKLGNTFNDSGWPVFEFRIGSIETSKFVEFVNKIRCELRKRGGIDNMNINFDNGKYA